MIKFTRYFLDLLKLTLLTATAIVCAAGIYVTFSFATSPSARRTFADAT